MPQLTLKGRVREDFLAKYSSILFKSAGNKTEVAAVVRNILEGILSQPRNPLKEQERDNIINELVDEFAGLGPIPGNSLNSITWIFRRAPHRMPSRGVARIGGFQPITGPV